jgi:DNA primase
MLVAEGFEVNVATLPQGDDPDTFVRKNGGQAYGERLQRSQPYLEYLLDRAAAGHNLNSDEGRVNFLNELLPVAGRIPDAARRDRFADRLSHKARVTEDVVRAQIRQAVSQKQTTISARELPNVGQVTKAEKGLIWLLVHNHNAALTALESLDPMDLKGLSAGSVLDLARKLNEDRGFSPAALLERLTMAEANLVTAIASEREPHVHDAEGCTRIIRRLRCEREYAELQREIDRLQELGAKAHGSEIDALWARKLDLKHRMEGLI